MPRSSAVERPAVNLEVGGSNPPGAATDLEMSLVAEPEMLTRLRILMRAKGYRFERGIEGAEVVERMFRPDGSLAMVARRPATEKA